MEAGRMLVVPASRPGMRRVAEDFDAFGAARALPPEVVRAVQVALDEMLSNIVHHGHGERGEGHQIEVSFRLDEGVLEVTIEDDAPPFDPLAAPPPDTTGDLASRPEGGLGILLTRKLMDEVAYERAVDRNRVVLRKRTGS
jgi:serine/threonine-protein kinase RsbW